MLANEKKLKNVLGAAGICAAAACVIASANQTTVIAAENYAETSEAEAGTGVSIEELIEGSGVSAVISDSIKSDDDDEAVLFEAGAGAEIRAAEEDSFVSQEKSDQNNAEETNVETAAEEIEASSEETVTAVDETAVDETAVDEATEESGEETGEETSEENSEEAESVIEESEEASVTVAEETAETAALTTDETAVESSDAIAAAPAALESSDYLALCKIVQAEAGSEPVQGKIAVANVIINRINNPSFPSTVEDVIRQPGQFGPVRNGSYALAVPSTETIDAVNAALTGVDFSGGALYFRRSNGSGWGSKSLVTTVGRHAFYV